MGETGRSGGYRARVPRGTLADTRSASPPRRHLRRRAGVSTYPVTAAEVDSRRRHRAGSEGSRAAEAVSTRTASPFPPANERKRAAGRAFSSLILTRPCGLPLGSPAADGAEVRDDLAGLNHTRQALERELGRLTADDRARRADLEALREILYFGEPDPVTGVVNFWATTPPEGRKARLEQVIDRIVLARDRVTLFFRVGVNFFSATRQCAPGHPPRPPPARPRIYAQR